MKTYISILRGINVSGQKLLKMDALKKMYESLDFKNITSYVQSGNVIFKTNSTPTKELAELITTQLKTDFGFDIPVLVLEVKTLERIIALNPFTKASIENISALHVTFLADPPISLNQELIKAKQQPNEEIEFTTEAIYLYCPDGYGKTKLTTNFLEAKCKVNATTRNWKTTKELLRLAQYEEDNSDFNS